jgi:hypothetical protein
MSDSATLFVGLCIALAIPVVAVTLAVRSKRASNDAGHLSAHFPETWAASTPPNSYRTAASGNDGGDLGIPPGYYADPSHVAARRYWDGAKWTKATQAKPS